MLLGGGGCRAAAVTAGTGCGGRRRGRANTCRRCRRRIRFVVALAGGFRGTRGTAVILVVLRIAGAIDGLQLQLVLHDLIAAGEQLQGTEC